MAKTMTVTLERTRLEVPYARRGKWGGLQAGYRWTTGYYVINPSTGQREYPPVRRTEAYERARELGGEKTKIIVVDEQLKGN